MPNIETIIPISHQILNPSSTEFDTMGKEHFVRAFNRDREAFKDNGGIEEQYDQFLKWAEVQKLERIHADLMDLVNCFKKG